MTWTCAQCQTVNAEGYAYCEVCGQSRPSRRSAAKPRTCVVDGAVLDSDGYCHVGAGVPGNLVCPHACPICRGPLDWAGGCDRCHGTATGRPEDWTFPGHGHELEAGHWQPDPARPPGRRACTEAENKAGIAAVRAILARRPADSGIDKTSVLVSPQPMAP